MSSVHKKDTGRNRAIPFAGIPQAPDYLARAVECDEEPALGQIVAGRDILKEARDEIRRRHFASRTGNPRFQLPTDLR